MSRVKTIRRQPNALLPRCCGTICLLLLGLGTGDLVLGDDPQPAATEQSAKAAPRNIRAPTFGGKQFWADELVFRSWRIQRNVLTRHCRLLNSHDVRESWGTFDHCLSRLDAIRREKRLPEITGKVVVVLHGLFRSRGSMQGLCRYLHDKGGYTVLNVGYPTTRADVGTHAARLAKILSRLDRAEEIHFVAHSLGNLVIRHYMADQQKLDKSARTKAPIGRFVMLGPPNQGARLARTLGRNRIFETVAGDAGRQLSRDWASLEQKMIVPNCEFGIIAGGRGKATGLNPLLEGDDDFVVSIAEARLAGAHDFAIVPVIHSLIMDHPDTRKKVLRFLSDGYFVSERERQPILSTKAPE